MSQARPWDDPEWSKAHRIGIDTSRMMAARIGSDHGVTPADLTALGPKAAAAHGTLMTRRDAGELPFYDLPHQDLGPIQEAAAWARGGFDDFLLIGIGGSSLGPKAAHQALAPTQYNLLSHEARGGPRFFLLENVDPRTVESILQMVDPARTCVSVVSKSGGTAETAANYMVVRGWLEQHVRNPAAHLIATTDPKSGELRALATREGWKTLPIPPAVGGRFSQLTAVGLLPAAVCGLDVAGLLAGAADMEARTREPDLTKNPAYHLAALHYVADTQKGKPICVMMPYADGLTALADWFVQLWAESLGKAVDLHGREVHAGQTPLPAVGAIDQHSQLQLFVEGPNDKMVTFMKVGRFSDPGPIPKVHADVGSMAYLGGHTLAELLNIEQAASEMVLTERHRPNLRIDVPELNAFALGQLFFLFEVMTAFAGGLYGVNPFDQPGVEHGKKLAYGALGREGFEDLMGGEG
jgi:glucose-6-phosphate isomerase